MFYRSYITETGKGKAVYLHNTDNTMRLAGRLVGNKQYEQKGHLGNVRAVVSDERLTEQPKVLTASNYYPFEILQPNNPFSSGDYRFGFNGKEMDNDMSGGKTGAVYDYGFRIYDTRIAKFLSVDPLTKEYPWYTPYQFAGNNPIWAIDLDGLEEMYHMFLTTAQEQTMVKRTTPTKIEQWVIDNHKMGMANVATVDYINETMERATGNAPYGWWMYTKMYLWGFVYDAAPYTSAEDASVLFNGQTIHGEPATFGDYGWAMLGIVLPASGSTYKQTLKGAGNELLEGVLKKVDNIAKSLDDKHITAAVNDILGNPVVRQSDGYVYDHLDEVTNSLRGLKNQIVKLNEAIDAGKFSDEVLEEAKRVRSGLQKEKDRLQNVLEKAKKQAAAEGGS